MVNQLIKLFFVFISYFLVFPSFGQVINDEIATAIDISDIPYSDNGVDFSQADTEGPVPALDGTCYDYRPMVWYKFTFTLGANLAISVSNGTSNIILYTSPDESATDFSNLVPLHNCSNTNAINYTTIPDQSYYVLVANTTVLADISFTGTFIPPPSPPPNDEIVTALEITEFPFTDPDVNFPDADTEGPVPASDGTCYDYRPMVWYKFTTSSSGNVSVSSDVGSHIIAVYYTAANLNASTFNDLTAVSPCRGSFADVSTLVNANQSYYVMVGSYNQVGILFTSNVSLPVEFLEFSGTPLKSNVVQLQWKTSNEINNYGYSIERLENGNWKKLGFVTGQGNTSQSVSYEFVDKTPLQGTNYYRLKQIDLNNDFSYSKVISVNFKSHEKEVLIYPNPFTNSFQIAIPERFLNSHLRVLDVQGKVRLQKSITSKESEVQFSKLENGVYFVELIGPSEKFTKMVVKEP